MTEKDTLATEAIKKYSLYSAGAGLIPMPLVDFAAISVIQLKMLKQVSAIYGVPFDADRVRSIVAALIGGLAGTNLGYGLGRNLLKAMPVVGPVLGGFSVSAMGGAVTWAMGRVFMQHFASGGTLLDFDPDAMRQHFKAEVATAH
ncbi:MAG: YcjF family protein [Vicinamibacterales bacterium]